MPKIYKYHCFTFTSQLWPNVSYCLCKGSLYIEKIKQNTLVIFKQHVQLHYCKNINTFYATDLFLYLPGNIRRPEIADVFRGYTKRPVALNGLIRVSFAFLNMDKIAISSNNEDQKNQPLYGKKYPGMEQVKFVEDSY